MVAAERLRRNYKFLKLLKKAQRTKRKNLLEAADKDQILCLCDCANNILKGNIHLKPKEKKQLTRHKTVLRTLASGKGSKNIKKKRNLLIQKGGFLPALLAPILSGLAGGLVKNLFGKNSE